MRFIVKHEIRGRIRVHLCRRFLTIHQADVLEQYLQSLSCVREVRIYERTADAAIVYTGKKEELTEALQRISLEHLEKSVPVPADSGRKLNREYKEKLIKEVFG